MLEHFQKNSADIATPTGPSALDEHSTATMARTEAKTYNAHKPAKFAVHFYAVTGSVNPYISSFFDNCAGNKTGVCGAVDCTRVFCVLRKPYNVLFSNPENKIKIEKNHHLHCGYFKWLIKLSHILILLVVMLVFTDNVYTRHPLAHALRVMTDGEERMFGTIQMSLVDLTNQYWLEQAVDLISKKD